jgi:hypothetical protein
MLIYNEGQLGFQKTYDVEFVEIENGKDLTKNEWKLHVWEFKLHNLRVEDVDYQKVLMPTVEMCFAVTGRGPDTGTYNDWGTVYKLELDPTTPTQGN